MVYIYNVFYLLQNLIIKYNHYQILIIKELFFIKVV